MIIQILLLILGFSLLIMGAGWLVDGGSAVGRKYNVSDLAIGLTIVAFGTSMPEMVVNLFAAYQDHSGIVFGNIIGSNNFNLFIILGVAGLITPLAVQSSTVWKEIPISFFAAMILFLLANSFFLTGNTILSRIDGIILLGMFGFFLLYVYRQLKREEPEHMNRQKEIPMVRTWALIIAGLIFLIAGGRLVVVNAVEIAVYSGISETVIGLTIVAAGTSLPEMATTVVAAIKKKNDIAVGNIIGSNIFNIFLILGISAVIRPMNFDVKFNQDIYLLGLGTVILFLAMFSGRRKCLDRWEAAILLVVFISYTIYLIRSSVS